MTISLSGIYKITNTRNGKIYVGQSQNVYFRRKQHFAALCAGKHENSRMQKDYKTDKKYFRWDVLEFVPIGQLNDRERYWIEKLDTLNSGYNIDWKPYVRKKPIEPKRRLKHYRRSR